MEDPFLCHNVMAVLVSKTAVTIQTIIIEMVGFNVSLIRATIIEITFCKIKFQPNFLTYFFFKCVSLYP